MLRKSALLLLTLLLPAVATGGELRGRVVAVSDGDTIEVLDADHVVHVVRLANIDAPETSCHQHLDAAADACVETSQAFGKASKKSLSSLVFGKDVLVVTVDGRRGSSYGRTVGTVFVGDYDVCYTQVARGYAWLYRTFAKRQLSREAFASYAAAEDAARSLGMGLWADKSAVPPWEFRHGSD